MEQKINGHINMQNHKMMPLEAKQFRTFCIRRVDTSEGVVILGCFSDVRGPTNLKIYPPNVPYENCSQGHFLKMFEK